jgi:hypothetical protein
MPAYIPPDLLDNTGERTLADALVRLIAEWDQGDLEALPYNTNYVALVDALQAFLRRDPALKQLLADFERAEDRAALELETVIAEVLGGSGESERP